MNLVHLTIAEADLSFLMEAINLRSASLQDELRRQVIEQRARKDAERREQIKELTAAQVAHAKAVSVPVEDNKPSLADRRSALKKLLSTKEGRALSIAEVARRTGVSYVTARKAVITKRKH